MGRQLRYHIPGAFYHVMFRGNNGRDLFFNDNERQKMCSLIEEGIQKFDHRIHAFCLMSNHVHLLIQIGNIPLATIMHNLTSRYCRYLNWQHGTTGYVLQERYKPILLQEAGYFSRLLRYIHMNPVNACLVQKPEAYRWSGHRAYLEEGEFIWLTTHYGLKKFADTLTEARLRYQNYLLKQDPEEDLKLLKDALDNDQVLGDDNFKESLLASLEKERPTQRIPQQTIIKAASEFYGIGEEILLSKKRSDRLIPIRGAMMTLARKQDVLLEEMIHFFRRDASSISRVVRQFSEQCACNEELQQQYQQFEAHALALTHIQGTSLQT